MGQSGVKKLSVSTVNLGTNSMRPEETGRNDGGIFLFPPSPTSLLAPSFIWISTYSLPFVLFNLLYFPPAGFTASQCCISPRLLNSHLKPAALPPAGHFSLSFCERSNAGKKLHEMHSHVFHSLSFIMTLEMVKKKRRRKNHLKEQLSRLP